VTPAISLAERGGGLQKSIPDLAQPKGSDHMGDNQRRRRGIAMTREELDVFMTNHRTCRVATVSAASEPHITPMWFVWVGASVWLYSLTRSQRWADLQRNPRVAVVVDTGETYHELRGAEFRGTATGVGEQPRSGKPCDELLEVERMYAEKYYGQVTLSYELRHAWLRLTPTRIVSWDFRKLASK
jgi:hypothetical protein